MKTTCGLGDVALVPPANDQPVAGVMLQEYDVGELADVFVNCTVEPVEKLPQPVKLATGVCTPLLTTAQALDVLVLLPAEFVAVNTTL